MLLVRFLCIKRRFFPLLLRNCSVEVGRINERECQVSVESFVSVFLWDINFYSFLILCRFDFFFEV